jgi:hypothetical protein
MESGGMGHESLLPKALEEDLRFTEYRLQIARELPAGSFRDAVVGGIAARLAALASTRDERAPVAYQGYSGPRV